MNLSDQTVRRRDACLARKVVPSMPIQRPVAPSPPSSSVDAAAAARLICAVINRPGTVSSSGSKKRDESCEMLATPVLAPGGSGRRKRRETWVGKIGVGESRVRRDSRKETKVRTTGGHGTKR